MINLILNNDISLETAIKQAIDIYDKNFDIYDQRTKKHFINLINTAINSSNEEIFDTEAIKILGEGRLPKKHLHCYLRLFKIS